MWRLSARCGSSTSSVSGDSTEGAMMATSVDMRRTLSLAPRESIKSLVKAECSFPELHTSSSHDAHDTKTTLCAVLRLYSFRRQMRHDVSHGAHRRAIALTHFELSEPDEKRVVRCERSAATGPSCISDINRSLGAIWEMRARRGRGARGIWLQILAIRQCLVCAPCPGIKHKAVRER